MKQVVRTFQDICEIASPSGQEEEVRSYILKYLKTHLHKTPFVDRAGNIYLHEAGYGDPLLLCAHIDTVQPAATQQTVIRDGIIYSDGNNVLGADDKCAVAAMLEAYVSVKKSGNPHRAFELLLTVREETDGGLREFPRTKIQSTQALLSDISLPVGTIVTAAPYVTGYAVTVTAPGGHVGRITSETIHPLRFFQAFSRRFGPKKTRDTITNIAIVRMGESYNSVPQSLYFTGEIRTFSKRDHERFVDAIGAETASLDKRYGTASTLELFPYCVGYRLRKKDVSHTQQVLMELGLSVDAKGVYSVGDFNILAEWGITPVNIGNGAHDVHTTHEHIAVESLITLQTIVERHLQPTIR